MQVVGAGRDDMGMGADRHGRPAQHGQQVAPVGLAADGPLGIDLGVEASPSAGSATAVTSVKDGFTPVTRPDPSAEP